MRRATVRTTAIALLLGVALAACSSDDAATLDAASDEAAMESSGDDMAGNDMAAADEAADGDVARAVQEGSASAFDAAPAGRQLARTARLVVEVGDVAEAAASVRATATRFGGFVAEEDVRTGSDGFGVLTLRVPAPSLDAAVADLGDVGARLVSSSLSTEDLTDTLTDLEARLRNLGALETELLSLLGEVRDGDPSAGELLTVFDRVNQVRAEVERLEAQRAGAEDRVSLATVTVELRLAADVVEPADQSAWDAAWADTRSAFGVLGEVAVVLLVTVLPVGLVLLAPLVAVVLLWRRARRSPSTSPIPPPPASVPAAGGAATVSRDSGAGEGERGQA